MSRVIKPCPFCGGKAVYRKVNGDYGYTPDVHIVGCTKCNVEIRALSNEHEDLKERTIAEWNRRVTERAESMKQ